MYGIRPMQQNVFHHPFVIFGYNHSPMKKDFILIVSLSIVFTASLCARNLDSKVDTSSTPATIWLQNGEGKMISNNGDTIPREFF